MTICWFKPGTPSPIGMSKQVLLSARLAGCPLPLFGLPGAWQLDLGDTHTVQIRCPRSMLLGQILFALLTGKNCLKLDKYVPLGTQRLI